MAAVVHGYPELGGAEPAGEGGASEPPALIRVEDPEVAIEQIPIRMDRVNLLGIEELEHLIPTN